MKQFFTTSTSNNTHSLEYTSDHEKTYLLYIKNKNISTHYHMNRFQHTMKLLFYNWGSYNVVVSRDGCGECGAPIGEERRAIMAPLLKPASTLASVVPVVHFLHCKSVNAVGAIWCYHKFKTQMGRLRAVGLPVAVLISLSGLHGDTKYCSISVQFSS